MANHENTPCEYCKSSGYHFPQSADVASALPRNLRTNNEEEHQKWLTIQKFYLPSALLPQ